MKNRPILIVIITLVTGFVIGFLVNGQITRHKFTKFMNQEYNIAFKQRMMEIIRPDESQIEDIEPILDDYAEKVHESLRDSKQDLNALRDEMLEEIVPYLNERQITRLKEVQSRFNINKQRGPRPPGPPPGGRHQEKFH